MEKVLNVTGSMAGTLGKIQPFRYRGYVYDVETELYYLRSRYNKPEQSRFLNADTLMNGNLFEYCKDNPTLFSDHSGSVPTLNNDEVVLRNGPNEKASKSFTIKGAAGAECTVVFPICDEHGMTMWYFVEYDLKTRNKRVSGYAQASDIDVDVDDVNKTLPTFYSINRKKSYNTRTTKKEAYDVYCLQSVLFAHHFLESIADCDGQYGPKTTNAVMKFQNEYNSSLPDWEDGLIVDGVWGRNTYEAMRRYYNYNSY